MKKRFKKNDVLRVELKIENNSLVNLNNEDVRILRELARINGLCLRNYVGMALKKHIKTNKKYTDIYKNYSSK